MKNLYKIIIGFCILISCTSFTVILVHQLNGMQEQEKLSNLAKIVEEPIQKQTDECTLSQESLDEEILAKYSLLHNQNEDMVGWLQIPSTKINFPVMKNEKDENYYLRRNFQKEYSDSGLPFVDKRSDLSSSDNVIIYGHNMNNGMIFADLIQYEKQEFWQEHPIIQFDTLEKRQQYEVVSAFYTKILKRDEKGFRYYDWINAKHQKDFDKYVDQIKDLSIYDTKVTAKFGEQLLTLSTCSNQSDNGRFVVVCKKTD